MSSSILRDYVLSRIPIVWVYSIEEDRLLQQEANFLLDKGTTNRVYIYDASNTIYDFQKRGGKPQVMEVGGPTEAISEFIKPSRFKFEDFVVDKQCTWDLNDNGFPSKSIMVLLDAAFHMVDSNNVKHTNARLTRAIKSAAQELIKQQKSLVFVNHHTDIPIELENIVTYVEHKLPDVKMMKSIVRSSQGALISESIPKITLTDEEQGVIAQQLTGLTKWQAENVLSLANRENAIDITYGTGDKPPRTFKGEVLRREKARLIQKSGVLKIIEVNQGLSSVGGMENLKAWAKDRELIFSQGARDDGIDLPRGIWVVGPSGVGKTHVAQALAKEWDRTILRLDVAACMGSLLGESEGKLLRALGDAEAQAPCILFIDEAEKLMAGASGVVSDGGTFQRMYGTWLTWNQSRKADVFVVCTTNSVQDVPAPALRKGRVDEIFYVGLPGLKQRVDIFNIHLNKRGWNPEEYGIDLGLLAMKTPHRTGSEIEQIVNEGLIRKGKAIGFGKSNPIKTDYFLDAIGDVKIMAELNPDEASGLFKWAKSRGVMMANADDDLTPPKKSFLSKTGKPDPMEPIKINEEEL